MIGTLIAIGLFSYAVYLTWYRNQPKFPNGPFNLPGIGSVPVLQQPAHLNLAKWAAKYGGLFGFRVGGRLLMVLSDLDRVKQVLSDENAAGRDKDFRTTIRLHNGVMHGLVFAEGDHWKEQRRFALSTLRDFGMGKSSLELPILAEVEDLCRELRLTNGHPIDPREYLTHSVSNIICALVFGKRFLHTDKKFTRLTSMLSKLLTLSEKINWIRTFPWLKYVPCKLREYYKEFQIMDRESTNAIQQLIEEHKTSNDGERRDYIDAFREEQRKRIGEKDHTFTDFQLLMSALDLFFAGTDTTSTTIQWGLLYLLLNPDVHKKVYSEMKSNIDVNQPIRMEHKDKLPYTEAVILEVLRLASITPINLPHRVHEDMTIEGKVVPGNSMILTHLYHIHRDPKHWKEHERFMPERFLGADGKVVIPDAFLPFSYGKRACLGKSLAKMELWLFFANIVKNFTFVGVPKEELTTDAEFAIVMTPRPFNMKFVPRSYN